MKDVLAYLETLEKANASLRHEVAEQNENSRLQREALADLQHDIWARWMRWMFDQGTHNLDGTWTMPAAKVERWTRQMGTPYATLPDQERMSDRELADEILRLVSADTQITNITLNLPNTFTAEELLMVLKSMRGDYEERPRFNEAAPRPDGDMQV